VDTLTSLRTNTVMSGGACHGGGELVGVHGAVGYSKRLDRREDARLRAKHATAVATYDRAVDGPGGRRLPLRVSTAESRSFRRPATGRVAFS
jgi:hypothetical protein